MVKMALTLKFKRWRKKKRRRKKKK